MNCKKIVLPIVYTVIVISIAYVVYFLNKMYGIGFVCVSREFTGLYCSGCGMTRAALSLLRLDFYQAFRYNAFSVILLPILFLCCYGEVYAYCFNEKNFVAQKIPMIFWVVIIILMLIYGVLRNIPYFAFLAPTYIG